MVDDVIEIILRVMKRKKVRRKDIANMLCVDTKTVSGWFNSEIQIPAWALMEILEYLKITMILKEET